MRVQPVDDVLGGVEVTEVDGPRARIGRVHPARLQHFLQPVARRATSPTVAPRCANIGPSAAPMPDDAPVTTIVAPVISIRGGLPVQP